MTTADVRDMLNLPAAGGPKPAKKHKPVEKRPEGISREVFQLYGDRIPPIQITPVVKYKEKPKRSQKVTPWDISPFRNPARTDGLVLRHWKRRVDVTTAAPATPATTNGGAEAEQNGAATQTELGYWAAKFNVKVHGPDYTDEQYEKVLQSEKWSRQETDYLVNLAIEYDLRWVVIADRYDYQPAAPSGESSQQRTMEDLKARYYDVASKTMHLRIDEKNMSTPEHELYQKMKQFDPVRETTRKDLAEKLLSRTEDQIKEEEILLCELRRIITNSERFSQERKELYARLEAPQSSRPTVDYLSSHGLSSLIQTLVSTDRNKKGRRTTVDGTSSPGPNSSYQNNTNESRQRGSDALGSASLKRGSVSTSTSGQRQLSPREEAKYGVSHHERLTSGVQFRHERIAKLAQAKSQTQTKAIAEALQHLGIPPRLVMPTKKVCDEYERLITGVNTLLEVRKVSEKLHGEIMVMKAQKDGVKGESGDEEEQGMRDEAEAEEEGDKDGDADSDGDGDGDADEDAQMVEYDADDNKVERVSTRASAAPSARSGTRKRSASVMSGNSAASSKRQRK